MPDTAEEVSQRPDVRQELARTTGEKPREKIKAQTRDKFWFVTHSLILIGCLAVYFLLGSTLVPLPQRDVDLGRRLAHTAALIVLVLAVAKAVIVYAIGRIEDASTRFTLKRVVHLLALVAIAVIAVSVLFVNWYGALTALGLGSVIIGLAVQSPMKSFIAWIYILVRRPYRVGDRIKIGDATGDVIDVGYLDTTLWEFGRKYISGDHPSGRIIRFPNEKAFDEIIWNYSWPVFPYIWNEIKFQIAYQSDLKFVSETMQRIVEEELGEKRIKRGDDALHVFGDELEVAL